MTEPWLLAVGETMALVTPAQAVRLTDAVDFHVDAGGAESNVASHAAALGVPTAWFSRLGDDALGHRIARQLAARQVDVSRVVYDAARPTGLYVKDPGHGVRYYRAGSAASALSAADAASLSLDGVRVVHVSGITAALSPSAAAFLDSLIDRARAAGAVVSFDVNHRPALWADDVAASALEALARRADLVFVGRDEAERLWGTTDAAGIHDRLHDVPELVVKDGDVGATAFVGDLRYFVPANRVDVVEAVGAGDAFAGGYLAALLSDAPVRERLRAGHARAALTLQTTGDYLHEGAQS
jgi:2-dehydro-3-deoxygluconokinase